MSMKHAKKSSTASTSWTLKCTDLPQFDALLASAESFRTDDKLHLRNLCNDTSRCAGLTAMATFSNSTATTSGSTNSSVVSTSKIILDYSRQRVTGETMELLYDLADSVGLTDRIRAMRKGYAINATEDRPVLHHLLRMPPQDYSKTILELEHSVGTVDGIIPTGASIARSTASISAAVPPALLARPTAVRRPSPTKISVLEGAPPSPQHLHSTISTTSMLSSSPTQQAAMSIVQQVHSSRDKIRDFVQSIRSGEYASSTGQPFVNVLLVASSDLCQTVECVATALQPTSIPETTLSSTPRRLSMRYLSNLDPTNYYQAIQGWQPQETLVIVASKTMTDNETMLNARAIRNWLIDASSFRGDETASAALVARHMVAITSNISKAQQQLGLIRPNIFTWLEWVSSRFSWASVVGLLPLALALDSWDQVTQLLQGAHDMDEHFFHAPLRDNIPVIMGLLGVWNSTFLGYSCRAVLPYARSLRMFPQWVQHVDMESNGKRVALDGTPLLHRSAEINFGQVGTDCQHAFFQFLHQGRPVPVDFVGFMEAPRDLEVPGEAVSNHDELMSHFFAQPDALAYGKRMVELVQEGAPEPLREHLVLPGNRPSLSLLFSKLDAYSMGQLLSLYEHRTTVQGFVWGLNSWDQFGLDLGKTLVTTVRAQLSASRKTGASVQGFNYSTSNLLEHYLAHEKQKEAIAALEQNTEDRMA